ncbi:MAG: hypothetical protein A2Z42_03365 [Candidatus Woykebacteria bacterium RBG_19FT_COMBO_43_10]|uniref:Uncharacterized protein n=1 Tax=Candidatus Woykebacteria bacterium RBG_19FT_COMBO_43_10 TaxID=1802598 RepID=A0A1G1WF55_9BACT|nr:MAG: hypothetical protein A2Z42_03365 [Candidatus Woykebacteria bacterium RBG_19FT_COMBO_43_10]
MDEIVQLPESQGAQTQKPEKPTSIKILQWGYLLTAILYSLPVGLRLLLGSDPFSGEVFSVSSHLVGIFGSLVIFGISFGFFKNYFSKKILIRILSVILIVLNFIFFFSFLF